MHHERRLTAAGRDPRGRSVRRGTDPDDVISRNVDRSGGHNGACLFDHDATDHHAIEHKAVHVLHHTGSGNDIDHDHFDHDDGPGTARCVRS